MSIKLKVLGGTVIVLLAGMLLLLRQLAQSHDENVKTIGLETLATGRSSFHQLVDSDSRMLAAVGIALKANPGLVAAYQEKDRARLLELTAPVYASLKKDYGITHWNLIDSPPASQIFLRMSKTDLFGDVVARRTYLDAVKSGQLSTGMEIGKTGFVLRTVSPIASNGAVVGYLELGEDIDRFFGVIKRQTGSDVALLVDKAHMNQKEWESTCTAKGLRNSWNDFPNHLMVSSTSTAPYMTLPSLDLAALGKDGQVLGEVEEGGRTHQRSLFPVADASGRIVGAVMMVQDISASMARLGRAQLWMMLAIVGQAVLLCLLMLYLLRQLIFRRLDKMVERVTLVVGGEQNVVIKEKDEIGTFESQVIDILKGMMSAQG